MRPGRGDRNRSTIPGLLALATLPIIGLVIVLSDGASVDADRTAGVIIVAVVSGFLFMWFAPAVIVGASGPATMRGLRLTTWVVPATVAAAVVLALAFEGWVGVVALAAAASVASAVNWTISLRA
ncbi:MAG: hypothetical protein AAGA90_22205 [Actinomycetota bacterium]